MNDVPASEGLYTEPILAWRLWRVRRIETLSGGRPLRLAAAGRFGIPRFWEPRRATRATCSNPRTAHEAPWPSCGCGIYGFRERADADQALARYRRGRRLVWALGRVSLWGTVVECERGWRAQLAYPYDLVVFADEETAAELRDLYAVDVTAGAPRAAARRRSGGRARPDDDLRAPPSPGSTARLRIEIDLATFGVDARLAGSEPDQG